MEICDSKIAPKGIKGNASAMALCLTVMYGFDTVKPIEVIVLAVGDTW